MKLLLITPILHLVQSNMVNVNLQRGYKFIQLVTIPNLFPLEVT